MFTVTFQIKPIADSEWQTLTREFTELHLKNWFVNIMDDIKNGRLIVLRISRW